MLCRPYQANLTIVDMQAAEAWAKALHCEGNLLLGCTLPCASSWSGVSARRVSQWVTTQIPCTLLNIAVRILPAAPLQVTDISTFTDDKKRAEVDAWLYETCTQCLQHIIDITVKFYPVVQPLLGRVLELLLNFIRLVSAVQLLMT